MVRLSLSRSYTFPKKNSTTRVVKFHFKVRNTQTFTSQFINSFLTILDNFIVMRSADVKSYQNTKSVTHRLIYEPYSLL